MLKLHSKRYLKLAPAIFLETLLFAVIVSGIGICASKILYQDKAIGEIRIGVVAPEDEMTDLLLTFVESMDSMKDTVSFRLLSREEASKQLKSGEIYGAVIIPEGLVDGILSGENVPARILIGNSHGRAETEVFVQLARAGSKLLTTAQAGIYAADQLCREMGREDLVSQSEDYLNQMYLKYALGRSSLLKEREVDALAGSSLTDYYGVSLFLAFLSFVGVSFGKVMQIRPGEREYILQARGVRTVGRYLIETAAFAGVFALLGSLLGVPAALWLSGRAGSMFRFSACWLMVVGICISIGAFLRMLFQVIGNSAGEMGMVFVLLLAGMAVSGIFIPQAFLPVWAERIGNCLPYKIWMEGLAVTLQGRFKGDWILQMVAVTLAFLAAGAVAALWRQRWGRMNPGKGAT